MVYDVSRGLALLPPHALIAIQPFLTFPLTAATYIWLILTVAGLAYCGLVVARELGWKPSRLEFALLLCFRPMLIGAILGQCVGVLAVPMTLAWRNMRQGKDVPAGVWFGLATSVKPLLLPLGLVFLWRRRWRAFAAWFLAGCAVTVAGLWFCGFDVYLAWFRAERLVDWYTLPLNGSVIGLAARLVQLPYPTLSQFSAPATIVAVVGIGAIVATSCWWLSAHEDVDRDLAVTALASLLIFPLGWIYYLPFAAGPLIALWARRRRIPLRWALPMSVLWWPGLLSTTIPATTDTTGWSVRDSLCFVGLLTAWAFAGLYSHHRTGRVHRADALCRMVVSRQVVEIRTHPQ